MWKKDVKEKKGGKSKGKSGGKTRLMEACNLHSLKSIKKGK